VRIAFHTPLKPTDHPTPSGDRAMARELIALLHALGHDVWQVDRYDAQQPVLLRPESQASQEYAGRRRARRIVAGWRAMPPGHRRRFDLWFTYHLYYKKPDWLGADVAAQLGLPYVVAEASHAPKRRHTAWRRGHRMVEHALRQADLVLTLNPNDAACVRPLMRRGALLRLLPPFLDTTPYATARHHAAEHRRAVLGGHGFDPDVPLLLTVAMMRPPDKLASYRVLAAALGRLGARPWQLMVVGDGESRGEVAALLAPLGSRVRFLGALPPDALPALYAAADLYVWPAINEAYGMTLLEAQAAGLAVVAGRTGGVPAVVHEGVTGLLPTVGDDAAFAGAIECLLAAPERLAALRAAAAPYVAAGHDRAVVGRRLQRLLRDAAMRHHLVGRHA
jgi:glycosyltransferase involved in cell wall biosynthesis